MYILSRDKKTLVKLKGVQVTRNFGSGKDGKFVIMSNGEAGGLILAGYPEEKNAVDEMEKIAAAIERGETIYKIPD